MAQEDLCDVVILSGGLGTRLRDTVSDRPKTMAPVAGRPFLEYVLEQVEKSGFRKVILCVGFLANTIQEHFGNRFGKLDIDYSIEHSLLGTAGAVRFAISKVESSSLLVMNGDSYCGVNLFSFWSWHKANNSPASIVVSHVEDTKRYGRVNLDGPSRITSFEEKGSSSGPGYVNAGIYLLDRSIITELPAGRILSLERDIFPKLASQSLCGFKADTSPFIDIGTPESFREAQAMFMKDYGDVGKGSRV